MKLREWKNRFALLFSAVFVSSLALVTLPGCEEGAYEDTGEEIDEELEDAGDAMDDLGDDLKDGVDDLDYDADDTIDEETP